jgi:uncharacterized protein (TIGR00725 family)
MAHASKKSRINSDILSHLRCVQCVIGVSGAAETGHCSPDAHEKAEEVGRQIARGGMVLVTGATTGTPYWAAKGAKEEGGLVIGFSPAASELAHIKTYRLPTDYHDVIVYTGFYYSGRNLLLTRASDAVIIICGRMGTLNELTVAFEEDKPTGLLLGTGGTADSAQDIIKNAHRGPGKVIASPDPKELVEKLATLAASLKKVAS